MWEVCICILGRCPKASEKLISNSNFFLVRATNFVLCVILLWLVSIRAVHCLRLYYIVWQHEIEQGTVLKFSIQFALVL